MSHNSAPLSGSDQKVGWNQGSLSGVEDLDPEEALEDTLAEDKETLSAEVSDSSSDQKVDWKS